MGHKWFMWPMADSILGVSASMAALRDQIRHLASFDAPNNPHVPTVLLLGETGTGKGLVARTMHDSGPRRTAPFVDVNCAAIPENMLEAELFGFEAGAFTDARRAKAGLFEAASGGTLFLDEVDALSVPLQSKLLKAIEEKSVRRLGALEARQVDVKLVAATQRDLKAMVAERSFRPDLYHRLAVVVLEIPPLRERAGDAVGLAEHFLHQFSESHGLPGRALAPSAVEWLGRHPWTGNVRELSHLIERVVLMGPAGDLEAATLEHLATPLSEPATVPSREPAEAPANIEPPSADADDPAAIREALRRTGGNVVAAARLLGIGRNALRYRMRRYGIERPNPEATPTSVPAGSFDAEPESGDRGSAPVPPAVPSVPTWEQKAVAVLAIDLAFPDAEATVAAEPWTSATHWQQEILAKVRGFGGVLLRETASRMVALFGIPKALEQSSERAVHAATAIQRLSGAAAPERRLAVHAGVVRIDVAAADPASQVLPLGDVVSLAERLLGHAGAGETLLSPVVARRLRGGVDAAERPLQLGPAESDRLSVGVLGSRDDAVEGGSLDPQVQARFVGRSREMSFLEEAFAAAESSEGQLAFVVGEAGIGKSRLLAELRERIGDRDHLWVEGRCTAYGATAPFLPIVDALRRLMGIDDRDDEASAEGKLAKAVAGFGDDLSWTAPYLRQLLSLRQVDDAVASLDSASRRSELFRALRALLVRAAEARPLVLVAEDLHWVDPASEEFLTFLSEMVPASRILLICSHRPGYQNPFGDRSYHLRLTLRPLSGGEIAEVAGSLLQAEVLPSEVRRLVASKAEGNPFFVEEVTKSLLEEGALRQRDGRVLLTRDVADVAVPDTIQEVLLARIDRLASDARQAIQMASVIGREFALRLLDRIVETGGVESHLVELRALELIYEKALHPELAYMFKHALTHEVAYESVVSERRRDLHRTIGAAIEELYADRLPEHYEALAHHFERGEDWPRALDYHARAAVKASESYANRAVIEHCQAAIAIANRLGDAAPREDVMKIHQLLGTTAYYMSQFSLSARAFQNAALAAAAVPEARGAFLGLAGLAHLWAHEYAACVQTIDETKALAETYDLQAPRAHAKSLEGQYRVILQEQFDEAEQLCGDALEMARESGDEMTIGLTSFPVMLMYEWSGRYEECLKSADRIIEAGNRTGLANLVVWPTWFMGKSHCCLGHFGAALSQMKEAYAVCDRIGDIAWKGRLLNTLGWAYDEIGDAELAREHNEQALVFARDLEDVEITGNAEVNLARNHLMLGDVERALSHLEPVEDELSRTGDPWMRWRYRLHAQNARAEIELARGEFEKALDVATLELAGARQHRAPKIESRAQLARGRALMQLERTDEAEAALHEALRLSEGISHPRAAWRAHGALVDVASRRGDARERERRDASRRALVEAAAATLEDSTLAGRLRSRALGG